MKQKRDRGQRGPETLSAITYPLLGQWTGLAINTVRIAARRGDFDKRSVESCLEWANSRRKQQGKDPIGIQTTVQKLPQSNVSTHETTPIPTELDSQEPI